MQGPVCRCVHNRMKQEYTVIIWEAKIYTVLCNVWDGEKEVQVYVLQERRAEKVQTETRA